MSYGKQLTLIAISNIVLLLMAITAGIVSIKTLNGNLADLNVYSIALKNNAFGDMKHEVLRSDITMLFYRVLKGNLATADKKQIEKDVLEHGADFLSLVEENSKLPLLEDIKQKNSALKTVVENYVKTARQISSLSIVELESSESSLHSFNKVFEDVEEKMEVLSDSIESEATKVKTNADLYSKRIYNAIIVFAFISIIIGASLSYWSLSNNKKLQTVVSSTVGVVSENVSSALAYISNVAENGNILSTDANMQAASIEEASATLQSISESAKSNVSESTKAYQLSSDGKKSTENGKMIVSDLISSMKGIESSKTSIDDMLNLISGIAEKTKIINDIAIQTHILSFNAAIESARSGAAGKGFAIVAEQVRSLANMSSLAAKDVELLITDSINKANEISRDVSFSISKVLSDVSRCETVFSEISGKVDNISSSLQDLLSSSNNQFNELKQVTSSVAILDSLGMNTAKTAENVSETVSEVRGIIEVLQNKVSELSTNITG